jgi:hypothetical protein
VIALLVLPMLLLIMLSYVAWRDHRSSGNLDGPYAHRVHSTDQSVERHSDYV